MKRFNLVRSEATTPASGEGVIAEGVQFTDGTVALRWNHPEDELRSTVMWLNIQAMLTIHGWDGKTDVEWIDEYAG